ncbi:MAG: glycoside hydrolase family 5 protein [Coriobacteriales bacterium]
MTGASTLSPQPSPAASRAGRVITALACALALWAVVFAGMLAAPHSALAAQDRPSSCGQLVVKGSQLCSAKTGEPVQLKGVSTHGLSWFPQYVNQECFEQISSKWGCNVVRLAMYTAEYNGYCTGDAANRAALRALVEKGVRAAAKADMYAIVDWHILSDGNPNTHLKQAKSFFNWASKKFKNSKNVIFEICNEPNNVGWDQVHSYERKIVKLIRGNGAKNVVLCGTPTWSQELDKALAKPVTGYKNLMYTLHFYAGTHGAWLRDVYERAVAGGLPVFVSEFGICDASGNGALNKTEANAWIKALNAHKTSFVCWQLSNKAESSSLIKASCSKTSGFTRSNLTASGRWLLAKL